MIVSATLSRKRDLPLPVIDSIKRVRFQECPCGLTCPTPSPLEKLDSVDEWCNVWYGPHDVEEFHGEARRISRMMREEAVPEQEETPVPTTKTPLLAKDASTRGLEQRSCLERQRRKYLSTRVILLAASNKLRKDPIQLAALARRCNAWATTLAIQEAEQDHARAAEI